VPYGENLVVHMIGRRSGSEVAAGRTCSFDLVEDVEPPSPHLYFARTVNWAESATPATAVRLAGAALTYADDGSGIFASGVDAAGRPVAGVDRFDPRAGVFAPSGMVMQPRSGAVLVQLDGPAVLVGGIDADSGAPATFVDLITLGSPVRFDAAFLDVVDHAVASGVPLDRVVEITPDGPSVAVRRLTARLATARAGHTATRLSNDPGARVLVAGGLDGSAPMPLAVAVAELYVPPSEGFADPAGFAPPMVVPRHRHHAIRLPDGSVLIVGGLDASDVPVATLELFAIESGFTDVGMLPATAGLTEQSVTPLPDGRVLIAGGRDALGSVVDTAFIARLDPIDGVVDISGTDRLMTPRAGHQATLLCDGTVLLVGGTTTASPAERYNPPSVGRR
jgi:hypothetical protein